MRPLLTIVAVLALPAQAAELTTKTPYAPRATAADLQPAPDGFVPVQTQLVARHGARGLTGMKGELALLNLWRLAQREGALTPLGQRLGPDLEALIRANAVLGAGVPGVRKPGYGNLSATGFAEHAQLAQRMLARLPALFADAAGGAIVVEHSGVDRAVDSAAAFTGALRAARPALAGAIDARGANRYTLYFHKLNPARDVPDAPWQAQVLADSLAYQAYLDSPALALRLAAVDADPRVLASARAALRRLFSPAFVARLARGEVSAANTGSVHAVSADGRFETTLAGDGRHRIASVMDAARALVAVVEIAPGLAQELAGRDFGGYLTARDARVLASMSDAEDFYEKGPASAGQGGVTWRMAHGLVASFFRDLLDGQPRAHLRFTHAEIIVPFAAALGLPGKSEPLPAQVQYSYANSPWRGAEVAPYAANVQWDSFVHADGRRIVRMLYNEAPAAFRPACDGARLAPGSQFYDVARLAACYGVTAAP